MVLDPQCVDALGPTVDQLLRTRAATKPEAIFLRFADGDLSFRDVHLRVERMAGGLSGLGVRAGDVVPVLLVNSAEFVVTWLALCRLGAIACLVNTGFQGQALVRALSAAGAHTVVIDKTSATHLAHVAGELGELKRVVTVGDWERVPELEHLAVSTFAEVVLAGGRTPEATHTAADTAAIMYTSGTTGPSKGCVLSHRYVVRQAELMIEHLQLRNDDVLYCPFPLFHIDATVFTVSPALVLGTTAAISQRFSASAFWSEVQRFGATVFDFMGATLTMLHKAPRAAEDEANPVRLAWGVPVPEFASEFERRFGLQLVELYGSTDVGIPMYHPVDEARRAGSCGKVIDAYAVQLVNESGIEVPLGEIGEIVVRPNEPSLMSDGYFAMPEATLASRRNLWFHTGDLARRDSDGYFYFVGRRAESIRRRGENISAFEVEEVVKLHPNVLDAAAYGVPSELTEDDVMVAVVMRAGAQFDPEDIAAFCAQRMARHMVPRYLDQIDELPRTLTEKIRKDVLRERGVTDTTWDREAKF